MLCSRHTVPCRHRLGTMIHCRAWSYPSSRQLRAPNRRLSRLASRLIQAQRRSPYSGRSASSRPRGVALLVPAVTLAELTFVPDEADVVEVLGDRFGRPASTARPADQFEAGVDVSDAVAQGARVSAPARMSPQASSAGAAHPVGRLRRSTSPFAVHALLDSVSLTSAGR